MIVIGLIQIIVIILILLWLLKKKPGERFSKGAVIKFLVFGGLSAALALILTNLVSLERDTFFGMNPILSGFLTAFITAALLEEVAKYVALRLVLLKNKEVVCWLDVIIASIAVGAGFTILENISYTAFGSANLGRVIVPMHLLFQGFMGYYYGKARITKQVKYDVLSLVIPIIWHTVFDMCPIGMMSILGDRRDVSGMSNEELFAMPYGNYFMPLIVGAVVIGIISLIALIRMFVLITAWSKNGEKQEILTEKNA